MNVIEIKESEFVNKIKDAKGKVLVDCYANWCGPCRMLAPVIEEVASETKDCEFYKINIDEAMEVAKEYKIMSIPTILVFENNELKEQTVGFKTKEEICELIK